jgi:hypothetical protein
MLEIATNLLKLPAEECRRLVNTPQRAGAGVLSSAADDDAEPTPFTAEDVVGQHLAVLRSKRLI